MADPAMPSGFQDTTEYASYLQNESARQWANDVATKAYNDSKAAGEAQDRALAAAKFAWEQVKDRAGLTGRFEDNWTFPSQQWFTTQFGTWMPGGPTAGQETLAAQQQRAANLGVYQGQQTLGAQQQYWDEMQKQAAQQAAMTGYWQAPTGSGNMPMDAFNARADAGTQQTYLAATGGNRQQAAERYFNDVAGAVRSATEGAGGQFTPDTMRQWTYSQGGPGATQWGGQGQRTMAAQEQDYTQWLRTAQEARANEALQQQTANQYLTLLSNLRGPADWAKYQQVLGAGGSMNSLAAAAMGQYIPGGGATSGYQPQAANLNTMQQQIAGFTPGGANQQYAQAAQGPGGQQPGSGTAYEATGNGTNMMGAQQQNQFNLPAPNQIAAQTWNNLAPSQKELIKGQYEAQGWYKPDVEALMNQGLPRYASNAPGAGTWRLR